ncbi:hypothetical protein C8Q79DRAFT_590596 [Trametes meyenii]|nr:hypothetical protein C8Q79DRAFT_590596 [Trametes meyenii]
MTERDGERSRNISGTPAESPRSLRELGGAHPAGDGAPRASPRPSGQHYWGARGGVPGGRRKNRTKGGYRDGKRGRQVLRM